MKKQRNQLIRWIQQAVRQGARLTKACEILALSIRTYQRWVQPENTTDKRPMAHHHPANKLTPMENQRILKILNQPKYQHLAPSQLVPILADEGRYIGSVSTIYRVLKAAKQNNHRNNSQPSRQVSKPTPLIATGANEIYSWDITYLPTTVKGVFYYLYLVLDIYSRKIVGWQVYEKESSAKAADLMKDICQREGIAKGQVTLHSDNGSPMKGATLLSTLQTLGIMPSFSRPSVSNDNPFSESAFRTLKYRPNYPENPFENLQDARQWITGFVQWYNTEHRHSSIQFITPQQRHEDLDERILQNRDKVFKTAKQAHPERWSGETRDWTPVSVVYLNPAKKKEKTDQNLEGKAA